MQPLTSEILKPQANELIESEEIHRQFIELVLSGGTYRDIAQGIAQRVGRPVTIVGRFRRVLGEGIVMGHPPVHKPFFRDEAGGNHYRNDRYRPRALSAIEGTEAVYRTVEGSAGPIADQDGIVKAAEGEELSADVMRSVDWFVMGVIGSPK